MSERTLWAALSLAVSFALGPVMARRFDAHAAEACELANGGGRS